MWWIILVLMVIAIITIPTCVCLYTMASPWIYEMKARRRGNYNVEQKMMTHVPIIIDDVDYKPKGEKRILKVKEVKEVKEETTQRFPRSAFVTTITHQEYSSDNSPSKTKETVYQFKSDPESELNTNYYVEEKQGER